MPSPCPCQWQSAGPHWSRAGGSVCHTLTLSLSVAVSWTTLEPSWWFCVSHPHLVLVSGSQLDHTGAELVVLCVTPSPCPCQWQSAGPHWSQAGGSVYHTLTLSLSVAVSWTTLEPSWWLCVSHPHLVLVSGSQLDHTGAELVVVCVTPSPCPCQWQSAGPHWSRAGGSP